MRQSTWTDLLRELEAAPEALLIITAVLMLGVFVMMLLVWGMIFKRAGYSFAMALLMFIPGVNFIWLLVFAFSRWPVQKELDQYKAAFRPPGQ